MLLLFNWCGYRLVADLLQTKAEEDLQTVIEAGNYNPQHLVELSVVTNLPYTNDWLDWEPCSGTIEVSGFHYQYVERKLEKGKMLYRCLPNNEKQGLVAARDEFFQLVNNFNQQSDQQPASRTIAINNFIGDYDDKVNFDFEFKPVFDQSKIEWPMELTALANLKLLTPHQPPEC